MPNNEIFKHRIFNGLRKSWRFLRGIRSLRLHEFERFLAKKGAKIRDKVDKIVPLSQASEPGLKGAADGPPRRFVYPVETKWFKMVGQACFEDEGWNRACNLTPRALYRSCLVSP